MESFLGGKAGLCCGDSIHFMRDQPDNRYDSIVCDPPYALVSIVKRFGSDSAAAANGDVYKRSSAGFMGKKWDTGDSAHDAEFWREALRVLKPGGYVLAFAGTRTYHRLACAIEDAGFEIRDMISWLYGSGFPKSHDVSKGIDRMGGQPWSAFAALLDRMIKGAGFNYTTLDRALSIPSAGSNSCYWVRTDERGGLPPRHYYEQLKALLSPPIEFADLYDKAEREVIAIQRRKNAPNGIVACGRKSVDIDREITAPATDAALEWQGWGTALKPACEPICMARKPLSEGTVAANVLKWGTGAINVDGCRVIVADGDERSGGFGQGKRPWQTGDVGGNTIRVGSETGRWPANVIHDGSEEVVAGFPDTSSGLLATYHSRGNKTESIYGKFAHNEQDQDFGGDSGSTARFFYTAKADADDRLGSKHPTVKPVDLMQYLVRLVTPKGGLVLDPFAGTGTTAEACFREGMTCAMVERESEYQADIRRRMALVMGGPEERRRESIKAKKLPVDHGPLFSCG